MRPAKGLSRASEPADKGDYGNRETVWQMHPVWDIPTRLFHWSLVVAVVLSYVSQEEDYLQVHEISGYAVLLLVSFRILWGFFGSVHSRFRDFVRGPASVWAYIRGRGEPGPGHNPAGGWSVLVMLVLLLTQGLTGLFNSDELMHDGPFYHALDSSWTDKLGAAHETLFWVLCGFITLHIASVFYYQFRHRDLLTPMVLGGEEGREAPRSLLRALLFLLFWGAVLYIALYFAPEPDLPW
jgi:cytochrome b